MRFESPSQAQNAIDGLTGTKIYGSGITLKSYSVSRFRKYTSLEVLYVVGEVRGSYRQSFCLTRLFVVFSLALF